MASYKDSLKKRPGGKKPAATPSMTSRGNGPLPGLTRPRRIFEGGTFSDVMDLVTMPARGSAALVGAALDPQARGLLGTLQEAKRRGGYADTNYRNVLREYNPRLDKTATGRAVANVGGFVADVALDPLTYAGIGLVKPLAAAAKSSKPVVRIAAKAGQALNDPLEAVGKLLLGAAKRTKTGQKIVLSVTERKALRAEVTKMLRKERIAVGQQQRETERAIQRILAETDSVVKAAGGDKAAQRDLAGRIRNGVGRALDTGYDAAQAAAKAKRKEQSEALRKKAADLKASKAKAAKSGQKASAFQQSQATLQSAADKQLRNLETAKSTIDELSRKHGELAGQLKGATPEKWGKAQGKYGRWHTLAKDHAEATDALVASESRRDALESAIREQEEIVGRTRTQRANVRDEGKAWPRIPEEATKAQSEIKRLRGELHTVQTEIKQARTRFKTANTALYRQSQLLKGEAPDVARTLAEHARVADKLTTEIGRKRGLEQSARAMGRTLSTTETRAAKQATVAAERNTQAQILESELKDPMARAMRGREQLRAAQAAKNPALDEAIAQTAEETGASEQAIRSMVEIAQESNNPLTDAGAQRGFWSPETAAYNRDVYAKRIYDRHVNPDQYLEGLRDDPAKFLREEARQTQGPFPAGSGKNPMGRVLHKRKDLSADTREGLQQIEDIVPRLIRGQHETGAAIARQDTLDAVEDRFARRALTPEEEAFSAANAPSGGLSDLLENVGLSPNRMVQVPDQAKYGQLRGQYVPHEVLRTFDNFLANPRTGIRPYDATMGFWKAMKVPFNPPTRVANRVSNYLRAYNELGIDPVTWLRYAGKGARAQRDPDSPLLNLAMETDPVFHGGLMGTGFDQSLRMLEAPRGGALGEAGRNLMDRIGHSYGRAETTDKLGMFQLLLDRGMDPETAAAHVRNTLFDYGEAPRAAVALSRWGVMPFARYPFLAIPRELAAFRAHPGRAATLAKGVNALSAVPGEDQTVNEERRTMHGFMGRQANIRLPYKDRAGRSLYLDATRFLPGGGLLNPENMVTTLNPLEGNPFLKMSGALTYNRDTFTGRDITDRNLPGSMQAADIGKYLAEQWMPPVAPGGVYGNQVIRAARGEKDREGVPYSLPAALGRAAFGLTARPVTVSGNLQSSGYEYEKAKRAWSARINKAARTGRDTTALQLRAQSELLKKAESLGLTD